MKTKLLALALLAGSSLFAGPRFFFGFGYTGPYYVTAPPPPPVYTYAAPVAPGVGYVWVPGAYTFIGGRYIWNAGYWGRPPFGGAYWVAPRYYGGRYYHGYWGGYRGGYRR